MTKGQGVSVMDCFRSLDDPRIDRSKRHHLLDIVAIAICAVICGADSWVYVELLGRSKEEGSAPSWTSPVIPSAVRDRPPVV